MKFPFFTQTLVVELVFGLVLGSVSAWAGGSLSEGEQALAQAKRDYFNAVYNGKVTTSQQKAALYRKTVGAASSHLDQEISQRWQKAAMKRMDLNNYDPSLAANPSIVKKVEAQIEGKRSVKVASSRESDSNGTESGYVTGSGNSSSAGSTRETALDGSGIPRLLQFGRKNKKRAPASSGAVHQ